MRNLQILTVDELKDMCKKRGIVVQSKARKADIIAAILEHENSNIPSRNEEQVAEALKNYKSYAKQLIVHEKAVAVLESQFQRQMDNYNEVIERYKKAPFSRRDIMQRHINILREGINPTVKNLNNQKKLLKSISADATNAQKVLIKLGEPIPALTPSKPSTPPPPPPPRPPQKKGFGKTVMGWFGRK
jgi:Rho termination factor, N-terminal domain